MGLALSLDEMASLHEKLMGPMREIFSITSGPLLYAWVIPVGLLTLVLFLVLVPSSRVSLVRRSSAFWSPDSSSCLGRCSSRWSEHLSPRHSVTRPCMTV